MENFDQLRLMGPKKCRHGAKSTVRLKDPLNEWQCNDSDSSPHYWHATDSMKDSNFLRSYALRYLNAKQY